MPPHPLVIPCPRETVGSGRDSRQNRQSIHSSAWLEWSITKFLGPACCYRRNQRDGARGELLSPDRSRFSKCVCVRAHVYVCVSLCVCELMRVNVKQMLTKVTIWHWIASLHVSPSCPLCPKDETKKQPFQPITELLKELLSVHTTYLPCVWVYVYLCACDRGIKSVCLGGFRANMLVSCAWPAARHQRDPNEREGEECSSPRGHYPTV